MIRYFPVPYEDELFYSACARFKETKHRICKTRHSKAFFGRRTAC